MLLLVQFRMAASGSIAQAEVDLSIDGEPYHLAVNQLTKQDVESVRLTPGTHRYDLSVDWVETLGYPHLDEGSGTIRTGAERGYRISVDGEGLARLVEP